MNSVRSPSAASLVRNGVVVFTLALAATAECGALEVRFDRLTDGVYAFIGDKGPRTADNEGVNANIGLVVTRAGSVLIDSGATYESARKIHAGVRNVTAQPVRWVINTGGQDHRWLGNGYFKSQGAEIIAHKAAVADMQSRGGEQLSALRTILGNAADATVPELPTRLLDGPDTTLELGGVTIEVRYRGGGHTPGDLLVSLPKAKVVFAGDIVYTDRLLAVLPVSNTRRWLDTFSVIEQLGPAHIVPGHGDVTDLVGARSQTRDYLKAVRGHMKNAIDRSIDIDDAVRSFNGKPFMHLRNAADLMPGNANRVYLEMELE